MVSKSIVSCGIVVSAFCAVWVGPAASADAGCFGRGGCGGCGSSCGSYYGASYGYTPSWYRGSSCGGGCGSSCGSGCGLGGGCGGCGVATCSTGYCGYSGGYCANYGAPYYYASPSYGYPVSADPYYGSFYTSANRLYSPTTVSGYRLVGPGAPAAGSVTAATTRTAPVRPVITPVSATALPSRSAAR
jgi:hypothetical protein